MPELQHIKFQFYLLLFRLAIGLEICLTETAHNMLQECNLYCSQCRVLYSPALNVALLAVPFAQGGKTSLYAYFTQATHNPGTLNKIALNTDPGQTILVMHFYV